MDILLLESEAVACSDDALMKASSDVIDALRRTTSLMQGELEQSVLTTQLLGICFIKPAAITSFINHAFRFVDRYPSINLGNSRHADQRHGNLQTADHSPRKVGLAGSSSYNNSTRLLFLSCSLHSKATNCGSRPPHCAVVDTISSDWK